MPEAVIAAIDRTPIGRAAKGSLVDQRPDDLGGYVVDQVLKKIPQLDRGQIDDVICGCALPGGEQAHNLGRIISILAGIGAPGMTVNRYCSSSLQAVRIAFHAIKAGEGDAFVCAGVESSTRSPLGVFADQQETYNPRLFTGNREGLPSAYMSMGETAENVADKHDVSREAMDRFAAQSHARAVRAEKDGVFAGEIIPVPLLSGATMTSDDGPRPDTTQEKLAGLRPGFRQNGRVTAGKRMPLDERVYELFLARLREAGLRKDRPGDSGKLVSAQRGSRSRGGDVRHAGQAAWDPAARPDRLDRAQRPGAGDDGSGSDRVQSAGTGTGRPDH